MRTRNIPSCVITWQHSPRNVQAALAELLARCTWEIRTKGRAAKINGVWRVLCTPRGGHAHPSGAGGETSRAQEADPVDDGQAAAAVAAVPELCLCAGLAHGDVFLERNGKFVTQVYGEVRG